MFCSNCGNKVEENAKFCSKCGERVGGDGKDKELSKTIDSDGGSLNNEFSYAGFWKRFLAYIVDILILTPVGFFLEILEITDIVLPLIIWIYFAGMESSDKQATLGKQALGIIVTDKDGKQPSFGRATVRHFAKLISSFLFLIGYVMVAFTEKKQGLHDMIANCLVINKNKSNINEFKQE